MSTEQQAPGVDRRRFLGRTATAGAGALVGASALQALIPSFAAAAASGPTSGDVAIVGAAQIAEALAVTTYTNIIDRSPFFRHLPDDDQGYLKAARQEEMSHYALEQSVTGKPAAFTTFYYPHKMFHDAQTTLNVLVSLEDAFIAAYLVGVRNFSTADLRVTAARIMGIESDHRTLARVLGGDVTKRDGGPIKKITGIQGHAERGRPAEQQRLRADAAVDRHQPGGHRADAIRRQDRRRQGRLRHRARRTRSSRSPRTCRTRSAHFTRSPVERTRPRSRGWSPKWGLTAGTGKGARGLDGRGKVGGAAAVGAASDQTRPRPRAALA